MDCIGGVGGGNGSGSRQIIRDGVVMSREMKLREVDRCWFEEGH